MLLIQEHQIRAGALFQAAQLPQTQRNKAQYGLKVLSFYKALLECEKYDEDQHEQNLIDYMAQYDQNSETEEETEE